MAPSTNTPGEQALLAGFYTGTSPVAEPVKAGEGFGKLNHRGFGNLNHQGFDKAVGEPVEPPPPPCDS